MTGLAGSVDTSSTGARSRSMSQEARIAPSAWPVWRVSSVSSTSPSAQAVGREEPVAAWSRVTSPPSSSIATRQSSARAWTARASPWAVTTSGVLWPNRITEARPASSTSPSHGGSVVPVKGAISTPSASASQEVGCMPQPFTAPAVIPWARLRWTSTKKITTGRVMIVEAAMIGPQSAEFWVKKVRRPTPTVYFELSCMKVSAKMNSFQAVMKENTEVATSPGATGRGALGGAGPERSIRRLGAAAPYAASSGAVGAAGAADVDGAGRLRMVGCVRLPHRAEHPEPGRTVDVGGLLELPGHGGGR